MAGNSRNRNSFQRDFVPSLCGAGLIYCGINLLSQSGAPGAPLWAGIVGGILLFCGIAAYAMVWLRVSREKKQASGAEPEAENQPSGNPAEETCSAGTPASGGPAEELALFLTENRSVVGQFKRDSYEKAFQAYREKCAPLCDRLYALGREEEGASLLQKECEALLDLLEGSGKSSRRKTPDFADQQQVALFLIPAFRDLHPEEEPDFPNCLRDTWNRRYPKSPIGCGTAEEIVKGFREGFRSILDHLLKG